MAVCLRIALINQIVLKNVTKPFRRNPESRARMAGSETVVRVLSSLGVDMHTNTSAFSCTTFLVISSTNEDTFSQCEPEVVG